MRSIGVKNKMIGDGYPAFIVAEMAWSHDSVEKAKKIIKAAVDANADFILLCLKIIRLPNMEAEEDGSWLGDQH